MSLSPRALPLRAAEQMKTDRLLHEPPRITRLPQSGSLYALPSPARRQALAPKGERGLNRSRWRVAAFYRHRLSELGAEIAIWSELAEECLAQRLRIFSSFGIGRLDLRGAARGRLSRQLHRRFGGKAEGDEERRVVDIDLNPLALS